MEVPSLRLYTHFCHFDLDLDKMRQAAKLLTGEHDYKSFCNVRTQVLDTVRTVYSIDIEKDKNDVITIRVCGMDFFIIWSVSLREHLWQWEWVREHQRKCQRSCSLRPGGSRSYSTGKRSDAGRYGISGLNLFIDDIDKL